MKLKKSKRNKKDQEIEALVTKALDFLMDEAVWTWADLGIKLGTKDDPSLTGNVIHRLKRNGALRALNNYEPGIRYYSPSLEHILKLRAKYENA